MKEMVNHEGYAVTIADKEVHSVPGECAWDYSIGEKVLCDNIEPLPTIEL